MFKRIIVPLDGSSFSEQALPYASELAQRLAATIQLVRVHLPSASVVSAQSAAILGYIPDIGSTAGTEKYLERMANRLGQRGLRVETAMLAGPVAEAIDQQVRDSSADLVVMTTHGRGGISRAWLGSVADALVRASNVPVLLLRPSDTIPPVQVAFSLRHMLIALDGSGFAEQIIPAARALAELTNARLTLLRLVPPPLVLPAPDAIAWYRAPEQELPEARAVASSYLEEVAARLVQDGFTVETRIAVQSRTALGIIEQALDCGADLTAMATRGRGGWARLALGSIAGEVLAGTAVPLLLLRAEDAVALAQAPIHEPATRGTVS